MRSLLITIVAGIVLTGLLYSFADFSKMDSLFVGLGTALLTYAVPQLLDKLKTKKGNSQEAL
ncbi:hypothetical protein SAMN05216480_101287 [Pustulibacterium marinum]|uniref:Uncharacterized protein n=1 Tax=Pustulibacterium marinum TaxID=1224947 RepID=A0A1I7EVA6_9FLAO|nr:hypothetical protein [Pustulibacterium marinum]SFU27855.1 hypothetical protein SAMN05216480_101287 [Pustulibacterium marinum]